jgi:hypothetical protein
MGYKFKITSNARKQQEAARRKIQGILESV